MLMVDGYIVRYNRHNYFYMDDELREAMYDAYGHDGLLIKCERESQTGQKSYSSYDFKWKCWEDEFDVNEIRDVSDTEWDINPKPTQSGWYLVTLENDAGQRYVAPLYRMEYPPGNFTWEKNNMLGKVVATMQFPVPYED